MRSLTATISLFLLLTAAALPAEAVVYLPGTAGGKYDRPITVADLPGIRQRALLSEKVEINGVPLNLELYQLETTLAQVVRTIKVRFNAEQLAAGNDFVKAVFKNGSTLERWLFVATPERPVTAFYIKTHGKLPPPRWPAELPPLPGNTRVNMVMKLPRLNAIYGAFDGSTQSGATLLASYTARMASAGWFHAGAEHAPAIANSGEIYFRNTPEREILWIKFSDDGNGAFYLKKIK